jgi:hypothetical protein
MEAAGVSEKFLFSEELVKLLIASLSASSASNADMLHWDLNAELHISGRKW